MNSRLRVPPVQDEIVIVELDGPPRAYFEIPLDYYATPNGELEPSSHPEACRLTQKVTYINFRVPTGLEVHAIIGRVTARLKEIGGGYIWWRRRPAKDEDGQWGLRLGTTPALADSWWERLSHDVNNGSLDQNVPGVYP